METVRIIENSSQKSLPSYLGKVWQYRFLIRDFTLRDIRIRYIQTRFGIIWSFIQALTSVLVTGLFFGSLLQVNSGSLPYILFAFPGMISWYYFSHVVSQGGQALVQNQHIIGKAGFPKLILPVYKLFTGLIELFIWLFVLILLMFYYTLTPSVNIVFLPLAIIFNMLAGFSVALWLSALTVRFRDFFHFIPYLIGFGIFVTPVFFETTLVPEAYRFLVYINPMAGVATLYRWCLYGLPFEAAYLWSFAPVFLLLLTGIYYFRRTERIISDVL